MASTTESKFVISAEDRSAAAFASISRNISGLAGLAATAVGGVLANAMANSVQRFSDMERASSNLSRALTGTSAQSRRLAADVSTMANRYGVATAAMMQGATAAVQRMGTAGMEAARIAAEAANATGAGMETTTRAAITMMDQMGMTADEARAAFGSAGIAAREAGVPLHQILERIPQIADVMQDMNVRGISGFNQVASRMAMAAKETGNFGDAVSLVSSIMNGAESMTKRLQGMGIGIDMVRSLQNARKEGTDVTATFVNMMKIAQQAWRENPMNRHKNEGDFWRELFPEDAARRVAVSLFNMRGGVLDLNRAMDQNGGKEFAKNLADELDSPAAKVQVLQNRFEELSRLLGAAFVDNGGIKRMEQGFEALDRAIRASIRSLDQVMSDLDWLFDKADKAGRAAGITPGLPGSIRREAIQNRQRFGVISDELDRAQQLRSSGNTQAADAVRQQALNAARDMVRAWTDPSRTALGLPNYTGNAPGTIGTTGGALRMGPQSFSPSAPGSTQEDTQRGIEKNTGGILETLRNYFSRTSFGGVPSYLGGGEGGGGGGGDGGAGGGGMAGLRRRARGGGGGGGGSDPAYDDSGAPGLGSAGSKDSERMATVRDRLMKDLGLTKEQASGLVGNLMSESGLRGINEKNPVVPGSRGGFGWAQWTGPRRRQFEAWAKQRGLDPRSDEANYGFLVHELKTTERRALGKIRGAQTVDEAARITQDHYERPGIPHTGSRIRNARRAYNASGSLASEGGAGGGRRRANPALNGIGGGSAAPTIAAGGGIGGPWAPRVNDTDVSMNAPAADTDWGAVRKQMERPVRIPVQFDMPNVPPVRDRGASQARREMEREVRSARYFNFSDVGVA